MDFDRLDVYVPVPAKEKYGQPTIATIHFLFDIPSKDFLLHIIAKMDSILRQLN